VARRQDHHPAAEREPRGGQRWRACLLAILSAALCLLPSACKPNKRYDLIEAELRTRERELLETRAALEQARNLNRAYVQQHQQSAAGPAPPNAPVYIPVKDITLARGTGAVDDGVPGDGGLMVVVVPRDEDGSPVKVPAGVQIAAWEITPAGLKTPIGNWTLPPEKVRPMWKTGFISTGYFIAVPWQTYPGTERVRIAVRLTTLDGRAFEADKDIFLRPALAPRVDPGGVPPSTPVAPKGGREPLLPDPLPPGVEELPPPKPAGERGARLGPPEKQ
jgi:hypothetical protein